MGCIDSKQTSPPQKQAAQNRGRDRSKYSDSDNAASRAQLPPPKPIQREDAFNYGRCPDGCTGSTERVADTGSTSGLPPAWDRMATRVAERGPGDGLTKESVEKSLAASLENEEWVKTNVGRFLNAGKGR